MTTKASGPEVSDIAKDTSQASPEQGVVYEDPALVVVEKSKKKKRKKYSKPLRPLQELEEGITKGNQRVAKAVYKGLATWSKNRNRSASKKRDGAIKDGLQNSNKSLRKVLLAGASAQVDVLDSIADMKATRTLTKDATRLFNV